MPLSDKTHREVKQPQISLRYLADYMAASERSRRTIVRGCKYQPIARVIQHDEAKLSISTFLCNGDKNVDDLSERAKTLRGRLADSDFERDLFDHNADYIDRFLSVVAEMAFPDAEISPPGKSPVANLSGVRLTTDLQFRLTRTTKTNKSKIGAGTLRYAKGKALPASVGEWQSAILFGLLSSIRSAGSEAERKLCLTLDAFTGQCYAAPSDAASRYKNAEAACATIAERWPAIEPPPGAIL